MPTAELDASVARLLVLAGQIERGEVPVVELPPVAVEAPSVAATLPPPPPPPAPLDIDDALEDDEDDVVMDEPTVQDVEIDTAVEDIEPEDDDASVEHDAHEALPVAVTLPVAVAPIAIPPLPADIELPATPRLTPTEEHLARLEQVRAELNSLAARRLRPRGKRRIEDAQREERELLARLGYDSYLDLMLTNAGTRQSESLPAPVSGRENAERGGNGGGGASSDIGGGPSGIVSAPPLLSAPPVAASQPVVEREPEAPVSLHEDEDATVDAVDGGGGSDSDVAPVVASGATTIAEWLASPTAPPIAASTVDVGA